jgi:hypothetical protein
MNKRSKVNRIRRKQKSKLFEKLRFVREMKQLLYTWQRCGGVTGIHIFRSVRYDTIGTMQTNKMHTLLYNYNNFYIHINS